MKKVYQGVVLDLYESNEINPTFVKGRVQILDTSSIANGTHFSKCNVDKVIGQLDYLPIRGFYNEDDGKFGGHEISYYLDDNNELQSKTKTVYIGVVIANTARWEYIDGKEILVCDCYIWAYENENMINWLKQNSTAESMEITIEDYIQKEDYLEITDFTFTSLCLINVAPAFEVGNINIYSNNDFKADYQKMINALDKYLKFEKGGIEDSMKDDKKELEKDEDKVEENNTEEMENNTHESEEEFACGGGKKKEKKMEDNTKSEEDDKKEEKDFEAEIVSLNNNYSELQEKYSNLELSSTELSGKYEQLLNEVVGLRQYKADKETEYRQNKETEIFSQFEDIKDNEKFVKLVSEKADYSLEELEEKCFAIYGMINKAKEVKKVNKKVEEKKSIVDKIYSADLENNKVDKLSAIIEKYSNK